MSEVKEYLPAEFMDEISPPHRLDPNAWIAARGDGGVTLAEHVSDAVLLDRTDVDGPVMDVLAGASVVFATRIARGKIEIVLRPDKTWDFGDGVFPEQWTTVSTRMMEGGCVAYRDIAETESLAEPNTLEANAVAIQELVTDLYEALEFEEGENESTVTAYFFTDGEEKWRLADHAGTLTFVPAETVH